MPSTIRERLLKKVLPEPNSGCWLWIGATDRQGYSCIQSDGANGTRQAHRVSYELFVGPIPAGYDLHHTCHQPACVNPDHLKPLSKADHAKENRWAKSDTCKRGHLVTGWNSFKKKRFCVECAKICEARRMEDPIKREQRNARQRRYKREKVTLMKALKASIV